MAGKRQRKNMLYNFKMDIPIPDRANSKPSEGVFPAASSHGERIAVPCTSFLRHRLLKTGLDKNTSYQGKGMRIEEM